MLHDHIECVCTCVRACVCERERGGGGGGGARLVPRPLISIGALGGLGIKVTGYR